MWVQEKGELGEARCSQQLGRGCPRRTVSVPQLL